MHGPHTDEWLDGLTPEEADAWLDAIRKHVDPVPKRQPVTAHRCGPDGYCTACPNDVPWLACPVWAPA